MMPIEAAILRDRPAPTLPICECGSMASPTFMRGQVQSTWRRWMRRPYCACICPDCKEIVGWERCDALPPPEEAGG